MKAVRAGFPIRELVVLPITVGAYAFVLHAVYASQVSPVFSYLGYRYSEPDFGIALLSVFALYVAALASPRHLHRASSTLLWVLFVVTVAPAMLMPSYAGNLEPDIAMTTSFFVGATWVGVCMIVRFHNPGRGLGWGTSPTTFWMIIIGFSVATYAIASMTVGLSFEFVGILDVYDVREDYVARLEGAGLLSYFLIAQANVVNPLLMAWGLLRSTALVIAAGVLGQLVLYSATGFKTILFSLAAVGVLALFLRFSRRRDGASLMLGGVGVMVLAAAIDIAQNGYLITSLFSRRFLMTPGMLMSAYVEFFEGNPKALLAHSVLSPWIDYPYSYSPPRVIGSWLVGSPTTAMNANLFADGFANFGWVGIPAAGLVLAIFLCILDRAAVGLPLELTALVVVMPAVALSNASVLTSMLSHGLLAAVLVLAFAPRDGIAGAETSKAGPTRAVLPHQHLEPNR